MLKKRRIAILYDYNENWIGSTYYIQNLISALNKIPNERKPSILIIAKNREQFDSLVQLTGYPFLEYKQMTLLERIANRFISGIPGKKLISRFFWNVYTDIDVLFPATHGISFSSSKHKLFWVADFQEHYLPDFFSTEEIQKRKAIQQKIVQQGRNIVLSSESARNDFNAIYPGNKLKQFVLPFAVTHPPSHGSDEHSIKAKYDITGDYFICSNQFWKHKNHAVVFRAIKVLKQQERNVFVAFTGKIHDYRNPQYFEELKQQLKELDIESNVGFLGFISREDQLLLMKNAIAVIQPSLFEGWSTVIEDAKALKARIIASSISVHKEQLVHYSGTCFFEPSVETQLAACIKATMELKLAINYDYDKDIAEYGNAFSDMIDTIIADQHT